MPVGPVIMIGLSPFPGVKEFVDSNSEGVRLYAYNLICFCKSSMAVIFGSEVL